MGLELRTITREREGRDGGDRDGTVRDRRQGTCS